MRALARGFLVVAFGLVSCMKAAAPATNQTIEVTATGVPATATATSAPATATATDAPATVTATGALATATALVTDSAISWPAEPVVISFDGIASIITNYQYGWSLTPHLVIYASGMVIGTDWQEEGSSDARLVWQSQISPSEVCRLLLAIEDFGFMDYNPASYVTPGITDANSGYILVQAWRHNEITAYALGLAVHADLGAETPAPALVETYHLLSDYRPESITPFQPENVALLVTPVNDSEPEASAWPIDFVSLTAISTGLEQYQHAERTFSGAQAGALLDLFQDEFYRYFYEDGELFITNLRPILPFEIWPRPGGSHAVSRFAATPATEMTCAR